MVAVVEIVEALDKVNVVYERTMPDVRKCTKDSVGRRSETFTGSKEVAVVEAVEALDKVDVDVLWRMSRGDERGLIFWGLQYGAYGGSYGIEAIFETNSSDASLSRQTQIALGN